jgi:hypothetical protein
MSQDSEKSHGVTADVSYAAKSDGELQPVEHLGGALPQQLRVVPADRAAELRAYAAALEAGDERTIAEGATCDEHDRTYLKGWGWYSACPECTAQPEPLQRMLIDPTCWPGHQFYWAEERGVRGRWVFSEAFPVRRQFFEELAELLPDADLGEPITLAAAKEIERLRQPPKAALSAIRDWVRQMAIAQEEKEGQPLVGSERLEALRASYTHLGVVVGRLIEAEPLLCSFGVAVEPRWIPVTVDLPEQDQPVLARFEPLEPLEPCHDGQPPFEACVAAYDQRFAETCEHRPGSYWYRCCARGDTVHYFKATAWMPLPLPLPLLRRLGQEPESDVG